MNKMYKKMIFIRSFLTTSLITSIRVVYMLNYLISVNQIASLKGIFSIIVSLAEIPTGVIADKISKKLSMQISAVLFSLHAIFYVLFPHFIGFAISQIFLGLSTSFLSGAEDAYLDDYIVQNTSDDYLGISGRIQYICGYVKAVLFLTSGFIFSYHRSLNFVITCILGILAFFLISSLPNLSNTSKKDDAKVNLISYFVDTVRVIKYTFMNPFILEVTLLSSMVVTLLIFNFEYYQVFLEKFHFSSLFYGILYGSFMIIGGYGAKISKSLLEKLGTSLFFSIIFLSIALSYLLFAYASHLFMIFLAIFIQQMCFGSWGLMITSLLLKNIPEQSIKSTMLSVNNSVISLLKAGLVIFLGELLLKVGVKNLYLIMSFFMLVSLLLFHLKNVWRFKEGQKNI